jgi:hypothetical protein
MRMKKFQLCLAQQGSNVCACAVVQRIGGVLLKKINFGIETNFSYFKRNLKLTTFFMMPIKIRENA